MKNILQNNDCIPEKLSWIPFLVKTFPVARKVRSMAERGDDSAAATMSLSSVKMCSEIFFWKIQRYISSDHYMRRNFSRLVRECSTDATLSIREFWRQFSKETAVDVSRFSICAVIRRKNGLRLL